MSDMNINPGDDDVTMPNPFADPDEPVSDFYKDADGDGTPDVFQTDPSDWETEQPGEWTIDPTIDLSGWETEIPADNPEKGEYYDPETGDPRFLGVEIPEDNPEKGEFYDPETGQPRFMGLEDDPGGETEWPTEEPAPYDENDPSTWDA